MIIPRKAKPYRFDVSPQFALARGVAERDREQKIVTAIPGVLVRTDGVWCARDTVEIVGRMLERPVTEADIRSQQWPTEADCPGLASFERLFSPGLWAHQPAGVAFLAARSEAFEADPCRTGKNTQVLGACEVVGAKKVVIATHGTPKLGWAEDILKWFGTSTPALILEGRKGDKAWTICMDCRGKGFVNGERCVCHRKAGGHIVYGWVHSRMPINDALANARFIIVNYDLLIAQAARDEAGALSLRDDLPGWQPRIRRFFKYDTVVTDELQKIGDKGWRPQALKDLCMTAKRVWAPTATPTDGRIIKLWKPLDIVSGGQWGRSRKRFAARYAGGVQGRFGFEVAKRGRTYLAETELVERLKHLIIQRTDEEINPNLPPIRRQIVRIQANTADVRITAPTEDAVETALNATAKAKIQPVAEAVIDAMAEGKKVCVYTRERAPGIAIYNLVAKELQSKVNGEALRARNAEMWCCIGKSTDTRVTMADAYSAHDGAAYFGATIEGFQTGRSLLGVNIIFYADLHWNADAIKQTERRSMVYERRTGLISVFFVVAGSSDEDVIDTLIPKLETLEHIFNDKTAGEYRDVLAPRETIDDIFARHAAHLRG